MTTRALFVCSKNKLRSPTAEATFSGWNGVECDSAGTADDAEVQVTPEHLAWSTIIFVMENAHVRRLRNRFSKQLQGKRVICLGIPDHYAYMQPELIQLLQKKAGPFLR